MENTFVAGKGAISVLSRSVGSNSQKLNPTRPIFYQNRVFIRMAVSVVQLAKRAFLTVLLTFAAQYVAARRAAWLCRREPMSFYKALVLSALFHRLNVSSMAPTGGDQRFV